MSRFRSIFPKAHTFLAVVHVEENEQAHRNVRIALSEGADGVFLISHNTMLHAELVECYKNLRFNYPNAWLGINFLDLPLPSAIQEIPMSSSGWWADALGIDDNLEDPESFMRDFYKQSGKINRYEGIFFGSVAFKYQRQVKDPADVAQIAKKYVDVVTTSGEGTGKPADLSKIKSMKHAIGDFPLAIASGITPENVETYMPYADCFLVATGISDSHTELNPQRVKALARKVLG